MDDYHAYSLDIRDKTTEVRTKVPSKASPVSLMDRGHTSRQWPSGCASDSVAAPDRGIGYSGRVSLHERIGFWQQFWRQNTTTGAVTPSSRYLASAMVRQLRRHRKKPATEPLRVVEMGPGTGAITREIARLLQPGDALDCYEINEGLARHLQHRVATDELFEAVRDRVCVHMMPAQFAHLENAARFVICSVPLNNLEPEAVDNIFRVGARILGRRGWFTYFEYIALPTLKWYVSDAVERRRIEGVWKAKRMHRAGHTETEIVWANIPPARAVHRRHD